MAAISSASNETTPEERAEAAAMRVGATTVESTEQLDCVKFAPVDIDIGVFKYVLIEATNPATNEKIHLVRGNLEARYHKDAAKMTTMDLEASGWPYIVLGGGRIKHIADNKEILVYGHSYGFPWEGEFRHDISVAVLKSAYPDYSSISFSNEGY